MPETEISKIKPKLRNTCKKYCNIKVPYAHRKIIYNLSKRDDIVILKQDKGRRVVIMDKTKYTEKCLIMFSAKQFLNVETDPTKPLEIKIQRILRKIKSKVSEQEYKRLYPTGSRPRKFYGTAKIHKLSLNGKVDDLPLRPIVSNINTATYNLPKFLSKLMAPLCESEYTVKNTKNFVDNIKKENIQKGYKMVSFDVKSLFTNVPLDRTINIILKRIYDQAELQTFLTRSELKEMLLLCTKKVHFTFNGRTYIQTDGVAMGSPLCTSRYFCDRIRKVTITRTNLIYKLLEKICGGHHMFHKNRICR